MKKTCIFVSIFMMVLLSVSVILLGSQPAFAKAKVLRLVIPSPPGDWPLTFKDMELAKRFNERAKGEYEIEVHAGGALAKLPEYFDAVRIGAVEIADSPWGLYGFLDPRLSLIEIPFLFDSMGSVTAACRPYVELYDPLLQEKFNAKALGLVNTGGIQLYSTRPVKTLEDWKGLLTGGISPPTSEMIKQLGGSPVTIMWTDMYESLQKKVIDATTQGTHGGVVMGMTDVCKHVTVFHGVAAWNGYTINLDVWKKMPKHIQDLLQEEINTTVDWFNNTVMTTLGDEDMKVLKERKVSVYILPEKERERWKKVLAPYKEKELSAYGEFGQKVREIAEAANKQHPYTPRGMY